jgi:folate-binding protein YgfZ
MDSTNISPPEADIVPLERDPVDEYNALVTDSVVFDRSDRHRLVATGDGAASALNGLVTNDIVQLQPGHGLYAAALSAKGKVMADLRIFHRADGSFLVDAPARAAEGWMGIVRKYVNPRTAKYSDQSAAIIHLGVFGLHAAARVARVASLDRAVLGAMEPHTMLETGWTGETLLIVASAELNVPGFDLFIPSLVGGKLAAALRSAGVKSAGAQSWEIARVEHGTAEWGVDMDENTLAHEANLDRLHAISFTKGCYTGQEVVARLHFRGHANQHLRLLKFSTSDVPPPGARIFGDAARDVGEVRSSVRSPRVGAVGIGMVRREVALGGNVAVRWPGGESAAEVGELPVLTAATKD